jgi:hypothetical protein
VLLHGNGQPVKKGGTGKASRVCRRSEVRRSGQSTGQSGSPISQGKTEEAGELRDADKPIAESASVRAGCKAKL